MYIFNRITVTPELPKRIGELGKIANNLWWSWNTDFLKLFKMIDVDLWERVGKNPIRFLKQVSQDKLEQATSDSKFLKQYDKIKQDFEGYMASKNIWFSKKYPNNKQDLIAYFSAEYGLDEILPIYSGGLGILSGDHLKSASDLGIPLVAVGLFYKNGYFHQKINKDGVQETEYRKNDVNSLPMELVKDKEGKDLKIFLKFPNGKLYLKVWKVNVGKVTLYLLDSDLDENLEEYRGVTNALYGGNQETRIQQEIVLGMGGTNLLKVLGLNPTVYHMNEGHSSFLILELIKTIMNEKQVSFSIAKDIVSAKTLFTTHTPVPAGNDIFPLDLVEKYFKNYWTRFGITKEEFFKLGMQENADISKTGFNMGILALKVSGKKNGVSKLHGAVSSELFAEVWPHIMQDESPIEYVTNGVHTCSWLAPNLKNLYNEYLMPFWQDSMYDENVWKNIENIPNDILWDEHIKRKRKLINIVKENTINRLKRNGYSYEEINSVISNLKADNLTIGFARRFATYKRATLIFRDLERITEILNKQDKPVQLIFAGKAHPADEEGKNLIKFINEISMKPQFKGKVFLLEDYDIGMSRYLVSGVDVWLNNPRRPMEASGTSGQKAAINGAVNFSVLDGWWAEGYNMKNGWTIGKNSEYENYEVQDNYDSESMYNILENKIMQTYYNKNENGISDKWVEIMKNSIISNGAKFSTSRMLTDYTNKFYMPLASITNQYYNDIAIVTDFNEWKANLYRNWNDIKITEENNVDNITINAGKSVEVKCKVNIPNIDKESIEVQVYCGKILESGKLEKICDIPMKLINSNEDAKEYTYSAKIELKTGGDYGYTFRVMPKHKMLLNSENLDLVKWYEK